MKTSEMPMIGYVPQNEFENEVMNSITKKGHLKASLPHRSVSGEAFYVWRNVAFYISPDPKHQCLPFGADFYLKGDWDQRNEKIKTILDPLVDRIVNSVPVEQRHGLKRWGRAFGIL